MRNRILITAGAALLAIFSTAVVRADVGLTVKGGTLGAGVDLTVPVAETINARLGGNYFSYSYSHTFSDVQADAKLKLASGLLLADWHPFHGAFRLSAGGALNGNSVTVTGKPSAGLYDINGHTYTATQIGSLTGKVDFNAVDPYVGFGWGNALSKGSHWSVSVDIGAIYQGNPKLDYTASGPVANDPVFRADLDAEARSARKDLSDYFQWYPVLSLGVSYRF